MTSQKSMPRSAYAERLLEFPDLALSDQAAFQHRGKWTEVFGKRIGPAFNKHIILEIGCFDAVYLSGIAAAHPKTAFVGIDWKCKAIYDGARYVTQRNLPNIVLLRARGNDLLKIFAAAEVDEIWIFHPDPCDRKSELKNRLISREFLLDAHAVLKGFASLLALKTDHEGYYQAAIDLFGYSSARTAAPHRHSISDNFHIAAASSNYWHDERAIAHTAERAFAGRYTLFESRFVKKRKPIFYLELRKLHVTHQIAMDALQYETSSSLRRKQAYPS